MSASDCVEVYVCNRGEKVADVSPQIRNDIPDKQTAREDAIKKCKSNEAIEKIHYYAIGDDAGSKLLLTFENPHWKKMVDDAAPEGEATGSSGSKRVRKQAAASKGSSSESVLQRVVDRLLFEDAPLPASNGASPNNSCMLRRAAEFVLFE